jgi:glycogen debranching enzyme
MLDEQFPIIAGPERPAVSLHVLKHGDCFGVFDPRGNIVPGDASEEGIYYDGTRFLSWFELLLFGNRPLLLSSTVSVDDAVFDADLTNPDVLRDGHIAIERGEINVHRSRVLWEGSCIERIRVTNFRLNRIDVPLVIRFDADFADVFEVRGTRRVKRGQRLPDQNGDDYVMCYRGLDERERRSRVRWSRRPDKVDAGRAAFLLRLESKETATIVMSVSYETDAANPPPAAPVEKAFDHALSSTRARRASQASLSCRVLSSSAMFNRWLVRSSADLQIMLTDTPHGSYPYAGIPWFSTPFGRDGLITAFELLWVNPGIARAVLSFLADTQATAYDDAQDAQPGKILHEMRGGEMAALGEVPFGRYYGSCDSTPLFVMLAYAYYERTADREFIDGIWANICAALRWMETSGDPDHDGFLDYARKTEAGLLNQGWKDSHDSIFHGDGSTADGPIALCEVQGYAYAAWQGAARLAALRGDITHGEEWKDRAERLRERFELQYWCPRRTPPPMPRPNVEPRPLSVRRPCHA